MVAYALLLAGGALIAGAVAFAVRGRRPPPLPGPVATDPWTAFGPRSDEDIDTDRTRPWPVLAGLLGLASLGIGATLALTPTDDPASLRQPELTPAPVLLALDPTPDPEPVQEATPTPTPTPTPTARPVAAAARSAPSGGRSAPGSGSGPAPAATPTPVPKPGPSVGASVSCFNGVLNLNYSLNARSGTTLSTAKISLNGSVVQQPNVAGRTQYSSSYQRSSGPGSNTFTVTATGSDGGVTTRSFPVTCS